MLVPHPYQDLASSSISCPEDLHVAVLKRDKGLVMLFPNYLAFILNISRDLPCPI